MKRAWRTHAILLAALLALNVAVKVTLWAQTPQTFPDSLGYIAPAMRLLDGLGYGNQENGYRPPAYPLLIAALVLPLDHKDLSGCREARVPACLGEAQQEPGAQANLRAVVAAQILLGILTMLLVYGFAWQIARNVWVAALCAATYAIDLSTGYWEISLLTDALTTFLLALAVFLTVLIARMERRCTWGALALGIVLAALALTHSVFSVYAVVPAAFVWLASRRGRGEATSSTMNPTTASTPYGSLALVLFIPALAVVGWSARNYVADGYFTPSSIAGYNLTQMVGPFIERAPAAYRDLADIYLEYRSERIAVRGSHSGTIFFAYRDMLDARHTTWAGLSQSLAAMSMQMIQEHPFAYLRVAWQSFRQFWRFGLGRQNSQLPLSFDWGKWFLDTRVHDAWMALFFAAPFGLAWLQIMRRIEPGSAVWVWFAIATVLYAAVFSSAFNFGDNERYRAHVARWQYTAVIVTAYWVIRKGRRDRGQVTREV